MATFRIHEDQENTTAHLRRQPKEVQVNVQQQKRSVLGLISSNVSNLPAPKPGKSEFNVCIKQKTEVEVRSTFTVYDDEASSKQEKKEVKRASATASVFDLPNAIENLPSQVELLCNDTPYYSPMQVDTASEKKSVEETDDRNWESLLGFSDYFDDIYCYMRKAERRGRPKANYMKQQPDVTASMRSILVDWLVEVAEEYKLHTETLYLAVSYIDRFLSYMSVLRAKLQLVGTAAMFIASKYEEIFPPDVNEFAYITDDTYTKKTVLRMEQMILKVLSFDVSVPTVLSFLEVYAQFVADTSPDDDTAGEYDRKTVLYLAMFLSELSLVDGDPYLQFLPSVRAAAAFALARHTLEFKPTWPVKLELATKYSMKDILPCITCLQATFEGATNHPQQAVREKYKSSRWHKVSLLSPQLDRVC